VLRLTVEVMLRFMFVAPITPVSTAKIVVLATTTYPTAIREVKLLSLDFFLTFDSRCSHSGLFEIVNHNLVYLYGWKL